MANSAPGFVGVFEEGRIQGPQGVQLLGQEGNAARFVQGLVVGTATGGGKSSPTVRAWTSEFCRVDRGEVKAENLNGPEKPAQAASRPIGAAVRLEGRRRRPQVERSRRRRRRVLPPDRMAQGFQAVQAAGCCRQTGVDAGQGARR